MYRPIISPAPIDIPQRPVKLFADGNSFMCPTDVMKIADQNDNSRPLIHNKQHKRQLTNCNYYYLLLLPSVYHHDHQNFTNTFHHVNVVKVLL